MSKNCKLKRLRVPKFSRKISSLSKLTNIGQNYFECLASKYLKLAWNSILNWNVSYSRLAKSLATNVWRNYIGNYKNLLKSFQQQKKSPVCLQNILCLFSLMLEYLLSVLENKYVTAYFSTILAISIILLVWMLMLFHASDNSTCLLVLLMLHFYCLCRSCVC